MVTQGRVIGGVDGQHGYSKQESTNYTDFETVRGQVVNYTSLNLFLSIHFLAKKSTNGWDGTKQRFNQ